MKKILYLVRHGQTDFNKTHRLQGTKFNESLNEQGVKEIQDCLRNLPRDIEVVFSSDLERSLSSAKIISSHFNKPLVIREELRERDFGSLAGKTWDEIPSGRELQSLDKALAYDYRPYGGESVQDATARLEKFLNELRASKYETAVAVTHNGIFRLAHKLLKEQHIAGVENASAHKFEV
ncbi:histidine phosphatase family protein [Candidatus Kaiserbacteria bacterium]|nr:histidine phosphatase family protein [Candidatus Kaiserbacteria bacterium]